MRTALKRTIRKYLIQIKKGRQYITILDVIKYIKENREFLTEYIGEYDAIKLSSFFGYSPKEMFNILTKRVNDLRKQIYKDEMEQLEEEYLEEEYLEDLAFDRYLADMGYYEQYYDRYD